MKVIPDFLLLRAFAMMMNLPQESKIGINDVSTTFSFFCVDKQAQNVMSIIMLVVIISLFDDKLLSLCLQRNQERKVVIKSRS